MSQCTHCDGSGTCKDPYHERVASEIGVDFVMGSGCPQGCGGISMSPGDCTHCNGSGEVDDD